MDTQDTFGPQPHERDAVGEYIESLCGRRQLYANAYAVALTGDETVLAPEPAYYRLSMASAYHIARRLVDLFNGL